MFKKTNYSSKIVLTLEPGPRTPRYSNSDTKTPTCAMFLRPAGYAVASVADCTLKTNAPHQQ